ncbi:MAG: sugar ABC transporter permease, partial [Geminicoccaceae bacterium]
MSTGELAVGRRLAAPVAGRASRLTRQRVRAAWLFVAPMLVVLGAVAGWPLLRTVWFAFTDANLADLSAAQFIG